MRILLRRLPVTVVLSQILRWAAVPGENWFGTAGTGPPKPHEVTGPVTNTQGESHPLVFVVTNQSAEQPMNGQFYRVLLSTIPRSGNHLTTSLLEFSLGISVESFFPGGEKSARTSAWGGCRMQPTQPCLPGIRRGEGNDTVIIKGHLPFLDGYRDGDYVLLTVRNPFTNFIAWYRFQQKFHYKPLRTVWDEFYEDWLKHHLHWIAWARTRPGCTLIVFQYEHLFTYFEELWPQVLHALPASVATGAYGFYPGGSRDADPVVRCRNLVPFIHHDPVTLFDSDPTLCELFSWSDFLGTKTFGLESLPDFYPLVAYRTEFAAAWQSHCSEHDRKAVISP